jgi:protoporphyrinogen oxidase
MQRVAIIGAGISGLSMAHFLKDRYQVVLFEKDSMPGGLIKCKRIGGSLFHTCGGHVFNSKRQDVLDWFWQQFEREVEFTKTDRNAVVSMEDGTTVPYPIENHMYMMDESIQKNFIEDLKTLVKKTDSFNPSNFEEFLKGRFGQTLYDLYFQPYNKKVWRRDLRQVPLSWLEGKLPMPTVDEMIYNNFNHVKEKTFVHSTFWYEKKDGSQYIIDKLSKGLDIRCSAMVGSLDYSPEKGWNVCGEYFDKLVYCGNIKDMVKMIHGIDISGYQKEVAALESHGTTAVFCEIDKNPYSWVYIPSEKHESHRVICTGNFSSTNNSVQLAENRITATVEFTDEISKEEILRQLELVPFHPVYLAHQYNPYTYPIQDNGTREVISRLKAELEETHCYFTGRFADWEYYNMDVAIGASMDLSKRI